MSIQWCAGLFVGEGSVCAADKNSHGGLYTYPQFIMSIGMLDGGALRRFAEELDLDVRV